MPRKKAAVAKQLTERDKVILADLARCRVLSLEQIKQAYWPQAKERTCRERLEQLARAGYVKAYTVPGEKPDTFLEVYFLERMGKRWATGPEGPFLDPAVVFVNPGKVDEVIHQVRTNAIYFRLSEAERATWRVGDVIELEGGSYRGSTGVEAPDAAYIAADGTEVFVETDTGNYTPTQIASKVRSFGNKKTIWVCPAGRQKTLRRYGAKGEFCIYQVKAS
ncbi:replication-relaxation family protein [Moorella naiadis]|uniref:replication-relaxation family protein n=1 Tax=Moorella naiadis (nom. illeg.) TaxID=3093670 RepID=UPI003D9CB867